MVNTFQRSYLAWVFAVRTEAAVWTMQLEELLDKSRNKVEHQQNKTKQKNYVMSEMFLYRVFFFFFK